MKVPRECVLGCPQMMYIWHLPGMLLLVVVLGGYEVCESQPDLCQQEVMGDQQEVKWCVQVGLGP